MSNSKSYTMEKLIDDVAHECGITKKDTKEIVEATFEIVAKKLAEHEDVFITGFGKFTVKEREERQGFNPKTKEAITIPASFKLKFKPSAKLEESVK